MLTILLAWVYITLLCWMWGKLFLLSVKKITNAVHFFVRHFYSQIFISITENPFAANTPQSAQHWWQRLYAGYRLQSSN